MSTNSELIMDDIKIRVIEPDYRERVLDFLRVHFYPAEPLTSSLGKQVPEDEEFVMSNIEYGTSLMGIQGQNDTVVVVVITGPKDPHTAEHLFAEAAKEGCSNWGKILKLLACVERDSNVFERYGVQRVLHVCAIGVNITKRGKHIGTRLIKELMALGKRMNYELVTVDCTNIYTAKIMENLGWECVNTVDFNDYLDDNQCPVFNIAPPHNFCKTYAKRL